MGGRLHENLFSQIQIKEDLDQFKDLIYIYLYLIIPLSQCLAMLVALQTGMELFF